MGTPSSLAISISDKQCDMRMFTGSLCGDQNDAQPSEHCCRCRTGNCQSPEDGPALRSSCCAGDCRSDVGSGCNRQSLSKSPRGLLSFPEGGMVREQAARHAADMCQGVRFLS